MVLADDVLSTGGKADITLRKQIHKDRLDRDLVHPFGQAFRHRGGTDHHPRCWRGRLRGQFRAAVAGTERHAAAGGGGDHLERGSWLGPDSARDAHQEVGAGSGVHTQHTPDKVDEPVTAAQHVRHESNKWARVNARRRPERRNPALAQQATTACRASRARSARSRRPRPTGEHRRSRCLCRAIHADQ